MKELLERKRRLEKELEAVVKALKPLAEEEVSKLIADRIVLTGLYDDDEGGQEVFVVFKTPHSFPLSEVADVYYLRDGVDVWIEGQKADYREIAGIYETAIEVLSLNLKGESDG